MNKRAHGNGEGASPLVIGRLNQYARHLGELEERGVSSVCSKDLAERSGGSAAQVRRDLMVVGYSGRPIRGYDVTGLRASIQGYMGGDQIANLVVVGVGNLGRALIGYFRTRQDSQRIVASFDADPKLHGRVVCGVRCHPPAELDVVITAHQVRLAMIVVPADKAQTVADRLVAAGVTALVNYAPVPLVVPAWVHVEQVDMALALEKAAYYSRKQSPPEPRGAS